MLKTQFCLFSQFEHVDFVEIYHFLIKKITIYLIEIKKLKPNFFTAYQNYMIKSADKV